MDRRNLAGTVHGLSGAGGVAAVIEAVSNPAHPMMLYVGCVAILLSVAGFVWLWFTADRSKPVPANINDHLVGLAASTSAPLQIANAGEGVGAHVVVRPKPGQSATGVHLTSDGSGTGTAMTISQTGSGTGLKIEIGGKDD